MHLVKSLWHRLTPSKVRRTLYDLREHFRVQQIENGHWRSVRQNASVDQHGNPIPWISYPAVEYINQLDFSQKTVFEYGSGNSTLFWAARAKQVISVELDSGWAQLIGNQLKNRANASLTLVSDQASYTSQITQYPPFDVIIIDGDYRLECAEAAVPHLADGGMIILDNSETHPQVAARLRLAGLIQVDMIGFAPIVPKVQATSFFLHRNFAFTPRFENQPSLIIGKRWTEKPAADPSLR